MASWVDPDPGPSPGGGRRSRSTGPLLRVVLERLAMPLRRALAVEQVAIGPERRPALRLTRSLIAGARFAGCTDTAVSECLGISINAVRTRGGSDGWIAVDDFIALADLDRTVIEQWITDGRLPTAATGADGRHSYAASQLMRALSQG